MKVTHVRLNIDLLQRSGSRLLAVGSITLDGVFQVEYIRVVRRTDGTLLVAMPSQKNNAGSHQDVAHPVSRQLRDDINNTVLAEYHNRVKALTESGPSVNIER